jgi:hypothetical protein
MADQWWSGTRGVWKRERERGGGEEANRLREVV